MSALGLIGAEYEVELSASATDLLMTRGFGANLSVQVYLNAAVDRYEVRNSGDRRDVIYIIYRSVAADRIVIDKIIQAFAAAREGIDCLALVNWLVSRQLARLEQIHICVGEHLCVRVDIAQIRLRDHLSDTERQTADPELQRAVALDPFDHVRRDFFVNFRRLFHRQLRKRRVAAFDDVIDAVEIELGLIAMRDRHILIDLYDNFFCGFDDAPHIGDLRT